MPLNTNIYAQFAPQAKSTQDYLDEYDARDMRDQQNKLNALGLQEKQRSIEANNRLLDLYAQPDFDPSTPDGFKRLRQVSPTHADAVQKAQLAAQETKSKISKQDAETLDHSLSQFRSFVPTVQSPEQVASYVTALYKHPTLGPLVQQFGSLESLVASNQKLFAENPKQWQVGASGMTGDKLVETLKGTRQNLNLGNVNQGSTVDYYGNVVPGSIVNSAIGQDANNAATQATARRGQDLTDTRAREVNATQGNTYDPERGVVVNTRTQTATPVTANGQPLKAKDKPMTEGQAKANLFGTRAQAADEIFNKVAGGTDGKGTDGVNQPGVINRMAGSLPLVGEGAQTLTNFTQSDAQQKVQQAKRDFINAVLRRESGAVIGADEFINADKQYFPQPNDGPGVIAQKTEARQRAIQGILAEVPGRPAANRGITVEY